jgi:hypothetical protein
MVVVDTILTQQGYIQTTDSMKIFHRRNLFVFQQQTGYGVVFHGEFWEFPCETNQITSFHCGVIPSPVRSCRTRLTSHGIEPDNDVIHRDVPVNLDEPLFQNQGSRMDYPNPQPSQYHRSQGCSPYHLNPFIPHPPDGFTGDYFDVWNIDVGITRIYNDSNTIMWKG